MEKSVVLTYFSNHLGVILSTATVCNKLASWCWTPRTITIISIMLWFLTLHPGYHVLFSAIFSEMLPFKSKSAEAMGTFELAITNKPPLPHRHPWAYAPRWHSSVQAVPVCLFSAFYFLQGLPIVATGKNAKYNPAGLCQGKLVLQTCTVWWRSFFQLSLPFHGVKYSPHSLS